MSQPGRIWSFIPRSKRRRDRGGRAKALPLLKGVNMAIRKPELAARIDVAFLNGDITDEECAKLHRWRYHNVPACLGKYNPGLVDCERQDNEACRLCQKLYYAERRRPRRAEPVREELQHVRKGDKVYVRGMGPAVVLWFGRWDGRRWVRSSRERADGVWVKSEGAEGYVRACLVERDE